MANNFKFTILKNLDTSIDGKTSQKMKKLSILPILVTLAFGDEVKPTVNGPENYKEYNGLFGQDLSGNVFIIKYNGRLAACMSIHQFEEGFVPNRAETLDRIIVPLDPGRAFKQNDVQIIPTRDPNAKLSFLDFSADYELKAKEKLWIERGDSNEGTIGTLNTSGLTKGIYLPGDGPKELSIDLETNADVRGASGIPVIQVSTGKPVGVLIGADDGERARRVVFEPICLPDTSGMAEKRMVERAERSKPSTELVGSRLFGVAEASITNVTIDVFSSMIPDELITLPFGTLRDEIEKKFPDVESVSYIEFPPDYLFHSADLLFRESRLVGVRTHIVKTPSKEDLERLMMGVVSTLGDPSIVMTSSPEKWEKSRDILFRWNKDDGDFVLFFYTGIGGFYGKFWFCSKLIDENQVWSLKTYTDPIDSRLYMTRWRDWLDLVIKEN